MSFNFKSIGHFFASAAHDVKVGAAFLAAHQTEISSDVQIAAGVVSLVVPAAAPVAAVIARAEESLLGDVLALVDKADTATQQSGLSLTLDASAVAAFKALLADIRKVNPAASAVPAGLPTTA